MTYGFLLQRAIFLAHKVLMRAICDACEETDIFNYGPFFQQIYCYLDEYLGLVALVPALAEAHQAAIAALPQVYAGFSVPPNAAEFANYAELVANPLQEVVQQHYYPRTRKPADWKYKAAPVDPTYREWGPEDFPDITHEELNLLIDDVMDNCLAGPDEIARLVMAIRSYLQNKEKDAA